jgi:flavodoxin
MSVLVTYDTSFGNTALIAEAICAGLGEGATAREVEIVDLAGLPEVDLLVIGSPTHDGRPTPSVHSFIEELPKQLVRHLKFAAFDTRLAPTGIVSDLVLRAAGHAAQHIAHELRSRGATEIVPAEGFVVAAKDGPLADHERDRAFAWGQQLAAQRAAER